MIRINEIGNLSSYFSPHSISFPVFDCADKNMNDHSPPPDSPNFHCSSSAKVYFIPGPTIPALPFTVPSNYKNTRNLPSLHQTFSMSDLVKSTAAFRLTVVLSQNPRGYPVRWCEILSKLDQFIKNEIFSLCYWDH